MDTNKKSTALRGLSVTALILWALGGLFFWWVPMGMVLSLAGAVFGFADWTAARRQSLDYRISVIAMCLCLAVLAIDIVVACLGLQTVTFGGY